MNNSLLIKLTCCVCLSALILLSTSAKAVLIDGKDWRQLSETTGYSWSEVSTVCPSGDRVCVGSLGTTDFTGWTWATVYEVGTLFSLLTPHSGGVFDYQEVDAAWAPMVFDLFTPTYADIGSTRLTGFSATKVPNRSDLAYAPEILDRPDLFSQLPDYANTANVRGVDLVGNVDNPGVWLYRNEVPVPVPEPNSMLIFGTGIIFVGGYLRRIKLL